MEAIIVFGTIFLLALITLIKAIKLVPQGSQWVVERLGKYQGTSIETRSQYHCSIH